MYYVLMKGYNIMKETVGEMIERGRRENGLSKLKLAELADISDVELARIESGVRKVPNPKTLRKISKYIGINYNDLMYAAGLGAKVSPLNPCLIEYYNNLKGDDLKTAYKNLTSSIQNNKLIIESLKKWTNDKSIKEEEKEILLDTIEDLEYQNETSEEIIKLLKGNAVEEFMDNEK